MPGARATFRRNAVLAVATAQTIGLAKPTASGLDRANARPLPALDLPAKPRYLSRRIHGGRLTVGKNIADAGASTSPASSRNPGRSMTQPKRIGGSTVTPKTSVSSRAGREHGAAASARTTQCCGATSNRARQTRPTAWPPRGAGQRAREHFTPGRVPRWLARLPSRRRSACASDSKLHGSLVCADTAWIDENPLVLCPSAGPPVFPRSGGQHARSRQ